MGYGGIVKSVFRMAATVVGGMACGPPCAAIGSAIATGATGGSFKEALMSGATAYIGSSITQNLSGSFQNTALANQIAEGSASVATNAAGQSVVIDIGGNVLATGAAADAAFQSAGDLSTSLFGGLSEGLVGTPVSDIPIVGDLATGASKFDLSNFGTVGKTIRSGYDFIKDSGTALLGKGGLGLDVTPLAINSAADLAAAGIGGLTTLTLNQALNADLPGLDEVLGQKFSPEQILSLRNEARNALSQSAFDRLTGVDGGVVNPFGGTPEGLEEFESVIARGIENQNIALGPATATDITASFANPNFGTNILNEEQLARINTSGLNINEAFPGGAFGDIDQGIIDSIVDERIGPAQGQISKFGARGNLNVTGGQTANEFIQRQVPKAQERVGEIGTGILGGSQGELNTIRDRARQEAGGYQLGDDLFDVTPFTEQRQGLIEERQGTLGSDIRTSLGSEPLFDVSGALQSAGRAQGVVSGQGGNQAFLDSIAARESGAFGGRTNRRGLSSRGSGAF